MIDPKELRIGNIVTDGLSDVTVSEIENYFFSGKLHDGEEKYIGRFSYDKIQPIPITGDRIQLLGFETENGYWFILLNRNTFLIWDAVGDAAAELSLVGMSDSYPLPDIKYIHQLQNLYFALTNKELKLTV